jgi:hypothetical protein
VAAAFGKALYQVCALVAALLLGLAVFHTLQNDGQWRMIAAALGAAIAIFLTGYGLRSLLVGRAAPPR